MRSWRPRPDAGVCSARFVSARIAAGKREKWGMACVLPFLDVRSRHSKY
jgi:hypothetical protein